MHIIVIGSGIAALSCMKWLQNISKITCITQNQQNENNSYRAQGGICFSKYEEDGGQSHIDDTYHAGDRLGDVSIIQSFITESHTVIQQLIDEGLLPLIAIIMVSCDTLWKADSNMQEFYMQKAIRQGA